MGFIPEEIVRQVLERADIVEIVSAYVPLKPAGRNFKALSPFKHEKTPSFIVSPDKQIFHCFSTGEGGNAISFIMKMERMEFPEAVRLLAERYGIAIPETGFQKNTGTQDLTKQIQKVNALAVQVYHRNLLADRTDAAKAAREYLKGRGVNLEAAKMFQLGFALDEWNVLMNDLRKHKVALSTMEKAGLILPRKEGGGYYDRFRNRIIFPIFDERGRNIAFGARTMDLDNPAKYINSPETSVYIKGRHLYGFNWSKQDVVRADQIILVEGYMDFIMPFLSGITNVAASLGTALTVDQIRLIRRYTRNVVMLFDADPAGEAAMNRSLDLLIDEGMHVRIAVLPDQYDPDSYMRSYGAEEFRTRVNNSKSIVDFKIDFLVERYGKKTVEARSRIAAEMLPTINRFKNHIAKEEAVQALARTFSFVQGALMTQEALLKELNHLARLSGGERVSQSPHLEKKAYAALDMNKAQRTLLMLMLIDVQCLKFVRDQDIQILFAKENIGELAKKIFACFERDQEVDVALLMSECDEITKNFLSALLAEESSIIGDKMKMCSDCIQRLKDQHSRNERKTILTEMELAKKSGDQQRLSELAEKFNRLIKGEF